MPRTAYARPPTDSSPDQFASRSEWQAGCDRCGASYTLAGWLRLSMVTHVESTWLAAHVTGWRAEQIIEVRRCAKCKTALSRRRPADAEEVSIVSAIPRGDETE
jgi:hypothetical protein